MDFGVLDGLVSSENNNKSTLISCCDLDSKPKWYGSGGGFCKQESSVSASATATHEDGWRDLKMAKISEDDFSKAMLLQQQRFNGSSVYSDAQNMLSFSSPNTQTVTCPYYARNTIGYGTGGPFTPSQWMELEHQALIYKYITANAAIPSNLLIPIRKALETAAFSAYSGAHLRHNTFGWGALHLGFCNSSDPEPGRCRRTDGKKWRCAKDAVADQKYCERHMNRGRHRSRKPVEGQTDHSVPTRPATTTAAGAAKLSAVTTSSTILSYSTMQPGTPNPAASSQDNRGVLNKANMDATVLPMLSSSSIAKKTNQLSIPEEPSDRTEFGLVCSDSLLNPMHKCNPKSQNSLRQFMEDWPHSNRAQLSISISTDPAFSSGFVSSTTSPTSERLDLSPLRMGLGLGNISNTQHANRVPISWETSMGGPLGEVLQHSTNNHPSALNLMTEGRDGSPQMALSPSRLLQKTSLGHLL